MDTFAVAKKSTQPVTPAKRPGVINAPVKHVENVTSILHAGVSSPEATELVQRACAQREEDIHLKANDTAVEGMHSGIGFSSFARHFWAIRHGLTGQDDTRVQRACCDSSLPSDELDDPPLQAKLRIGAPGDAFEQEADAVADTVMQTWSPDYVTAAESVAVSGGSVGDASVQFVQRTGDDVDDETLDAEEEAEEQRLQCAARERIVVGEPDASAVIARTLRQNAGRGQPMAPPTRRFMEHRLGFDFAGVRIHQGETAARLTDQLNAHAFTTGRDIYFAPAAYRPGSRHGDRLLAHELTHVVQQAGGAAGDARLVQRTVERKPYYDGVPGLYGRTVHAEVARRLRAVSANRNLITEAPIAHATRRSLDFDDVGYADLYRATDNKVQGFRGVSETQSECQATDAGPEATATVARTYDVVSQTIRGHADGPVQWRPELQTRSDGSQGMRYVFPRNVYVSDLKPWTVDPAMLPRVLVRVGSVFPQLNNYITGLARFGCKAKADLGGRGATPTGRAMQPATLHLPADMNFRNFDIDNNALGTGLRNGQRDERIWLIKPGPGLVLYVPVPLGTAGQGTSLRRWLRENDQRLTQMRRDLRGTTPRINTPTDISAKFKSNQAKPLKPVAKAAVSSRPLVQRNRRTHRPGQVNWSQRRRRWQRERKRWRRGVRRYLRRRGRILRDVAKVADKAGTSLGPGSRVAALGRNVEAIDFWSGPWGGFVGGLRFRLGSAWDFFAEKLESLRQRFRRWSRRAKSFGRGGVSAGWRGRLIRAIMRAGGVAITQFLTDTFRVFSGCATGLMQKALRQILDEASPETRERFCQLQQGFGSISDELDRLFQQHFAGYEEAIEALGAVGFWASLITSLIDLIRIGVQVVSCLSPPALGCLWGLVVNVGIEIAVNLVVGTEWFQREVIGSQQVRNFFARFFRPAQQGLLDAAINAAGLQELRRGVSQCDLSPASRDPLRGGAPGGLRGGALMRRRQAWERANRAAIHQGIRDNYANAQGQPASPQDAIGLLSTVGFADLSHEQIRRIIQQSRGPDGRVSIPNARRRFVGAGVSRLFEGAEQILPELGAAPEEGGLPAQRGAAPPAAEGAGAPPAPEAPAGEAPPTPGATTPATPEAQSGLPVHSQAFRAPPAGHRGGGQRHEIQTDVVAGMSPSRQPAPDRTFHVTLEFFFEGAVYRVSRVPVRLVGTRQQRDGRTVYQLRLMQAFWIESIDLTLSPGMFEFAFARGL